MKNSFEVFKILASGVPVSVEKSEDLKKAVTAAFVLAIHAPGRYTVWSEGRTTELILDLADFETREHDLPL
jgi:hypothetical protein